ncbi:MAG: hypothetical protein KAI67_04620 [Candidatus Pacebacteria bacterium]|nr:hypothetical protein [Candidatus Paceibacterota bacterium]
MKKFIKTFLVVCFVLLTATFFAGNVDEAHAVFLGEPTCAANDGCLPSCLVDFGVDDPDCLPGCVVDGSAGLIPCGRSCDDGLTAMDEAAPCTLCHGILMSQLIVEFLLKMAGIASVLAIALGGFLYMFAAGSQGLTSTAKSILKSVLIGFILVFIAWVLIDTIMTTFGYIDPLGGEWHVMDC